MAEITTKQINLKKVSEKYNELIKQKSGKCSKILFLISDGKLIEKIKKKYKHKYIHRRTTNIDIHIIHNEGIGKILDLNI